MHRTNPVLADARRLQQQRREQQRTYNSHDLLQHGPEDPAKILARIRRMLNDCEQRAQDNALSENALALALLVTAVKVQLAGQDVRQALLLRHPGAADGQSYLDALCDAVTFLHTRVLHDHSLTAHWIVSSLLSQLVAMSLTRPLVTEEPRELSRRNDGVFRNCLSSARPSGLRAEPDLPRTRAGRGRQQRIRATQHQQASLQARQDARVLADPPPLDSFLHPLALASFLCRTLVLLPTTQAVALYTSTHSANAPDTLSACLTVRVRERKEIVVIEWTTALRGCECERATTTEDQAMRSAYARALPFFTFSGRSKSVW